MKLQYFSDWVTKIVAVAGFTVLLRIRIKLTWTHYFSPGHPSLLIKKWQSKVNVPDNLVWGPGPNELGVWKHFLRDSSKAYAKCLWPDCTTVLHCPKNNTSRMRNHVAKCHSSSIPPKRLDTRAAPVQWKAFQ